MSHSVWAKDMACLVASAKHDVSVIEAEGTLIVDQRQQLADWALGKDADWILWLDTDMRFPADALERLLAHNKPIVAANYVSRKMPVGPVARNYTAGGWVKVPTYSNSTGLEEVTACGMGVTLTKAEIFKKMELPWFHLGYATSNNQFTGEDVYFGIHAAKVGYPTFIDHDLSREVRHIGSVEFMHEHFELFDKNGDH